MKRSHAGWLCPVDRRGKIPKTTKTTWRVIAESQAARLPALNRAHAITGWSFATLIQLPEVLLVAITSRQMTAVDIDRMYPSKVTK